MLVVMLVMLVVLVVLVLCGGKGTDASSAQVA